MFLSWVLKTVYEGHYLFSSEEFCGFNGNLEGLAGGGCCCCKDCWWPPPNSYVDFFNIPLGIEDLGGGGGGGKPKSEFCRTIMLPFGAEVDGLFLRVKVSWNPLNDDGCSSVELPPLAVEETPLLPEELLPLRNFCWMEAILGEIFSPPFNRLPLAWFITGGNSFAIVCLVWTSVGMLLLIATPSTEWSLANGGGGMMKAEMSSKASVFWFHWVSGGGGTVIFAMNESMSLSWYTAAKPSTSSWFGNPLKL